MDRDVSTRTSAQEGTVPLGGVDLSVGGEDGAEYAYLDSGDCRRLERFGPVVLDRPAPQAFWPRHLPESRWAAAEARFLRRSDGGGDWIYRNRELAPWKLQCGPLHFEVHPTGFGHLGVFPEQIPNWRWIERTLNPVQNPAVLNLFAYTGGISLAAARGGASVTHLDAVKGVVQWASENARLNELGRGSIRWIVDDVSKFVRREQRRGTRYEAIILDPPSFGRGNQGEVWKLEEELPNLLAQCTELLSERALFLLVSAHTPGVTPAVLRNLLLPLGRTRGGRVQAGEMLLTSRESPHVLPSGAYARWEAARP